MLHRFIFTFLLLIRTWANGQNQLPQGCLTGISDSEMRVHCNDPDEIPKGVPVQTTKLIIACSQQTEKRFIDRLKADSFLHIPNLQHFESRGCPIASIEDGTFEKLIYLRNLTIDTANIQEFAIDRAFPNASCALEAIHIANCPGLTRLISGRSSPNEGQQRMRLSTLILVNTSIPLSDVSEVIAPSACCLRELVIGSSQVPLHGAIFEGNRFNLTRVSLEDNKFDDLDILLNLSVDQLSLQGSRFPDQKWTKFVQLCASLVHLDLTNTEQETLSFYRMAQLRELILANNRIKYLPWNYLSTLVKRTPMLATLDLQSNQLTTFPHQMKTASSRMKVRLSEMLNLRLEGNPIHCNCELDWLIKDPQVVKLKEELPCLTLATISPETGYKISMSVQTMGELLQTKDFQLACLKPTNPRFSIRGGKRIEKRKKKEGVNYEETVYDLKTEGRSDLWIECMSSGDPPPTISWRNALTGAIESENFVIKQRGISVHPTPALLNLSGIDRTINMTCEANNTVGSAYARLEVSFTAERDDSTKQVSHMGMVTTSSSPIIFPSAFSMIIFISFLFYQFKMIF